MAKSEELTVEKAITLLRGLSKMLNTAADGFEAAIKQGLISPADTVATAKKKVAEHPEYKKLGLP